MGIWTSRDSSALLDAAYDLQGADSLDAVRNLGAQWAGRLIPHLRSGAIAVDTRTGYFGGVHYPAPIPHILELAPADPREIALVAPLLRAPGFDVHTLSDIVDRGTWRNSRIYVELYRPHGLEFQLVAPVAFRRSSSRTARTPEPVDRFESLSISRTDRDFTIRERDLLTEFSRHVRAAFSRLRRSAPRVTDHRLTARQVEVLRLIARGRTARGVASELGITPKTVENHLQAAYASLQVSNRVDALRRMRGEI